jgi:hypothetical protein
MILMVADRMNHTLIEPGSRSFPQEKESVYLMPARGIHT